MTEKKKETEKNTYRCKPVTPRVSEERSKEKKNRKVKKQRGTPAAVSS
jgi:hypothetical protein